MVSPVSADRRGRVRHAGRSGIAVHARTLRTNQPDLVIAAVQGQIAHPIGRATPYRISQGGQPIVLPGTGGISINQRIGDRCVGVMGDHVEPGVALHNNTREVVGPRAGPNMALLTYACVGNRAEVITGPCRGEVGMVTGKHGGINHVLVDFPTTILTRLRIGDRLQIRALGLGLRLLDFPEIVISNCDPGLLAAWQMGVEGGQLQVPVTHLVPSEVAGSGLGKNTVWRGDFDLQLFDRETRRRYRLDALRYGDMVAVAHIDARFGPSFRRNRITIGVIVHSDSVVSGHGPGVCVLMTGPARLLRPMRSPGANLALLTGRRLLPPARAYPKLIADQFCSPKAQAHRR